MAGFGCPPRGNCGFVEHRHNLVITGPTGVGKSYLACAFVERACRRGYKGAYVRLPRLLQQIAVASGDGSYARILERLAKLDLLAIDDWPLAPLRDTKRRDLVEVIEDRSERASTLIASQLASKDWHGSIGDPNLADAICDRLLHNAHRIQLKGPTKRGGKPDPKAPAVAAKRRPTAVVASLRGTRGRCRACRGPWETGKRPPVSHKRPQARRPDHSVEGGLAQPTA